MRNLFKLFFLNLLLAGANSFFAGEYTKLWTKQINPADPKDRGLFTKCLMNCVLPNYPNGLKKGKKVRIMKRCVLNCRHLEKCKNFVHCV